MKTAPSAITGRTKPAVLSGPHRPTAAGLLVLGRWPKGLVDPQLGNWRFEVIDLDGRRIDKLLMRAVQTTQWALPDSAVRSILDESEVLIGGKEWNIAECGSPECRWR